MRLVVIAAALLPALLQAQSPCNNTPAYSPCELVFQLSEKDAAANPNPDATVQLSIDFRSPRHRTVAMPGYWDGGRRMVVRFSPTEPGNWDYLVNSNLAEWNEKTGSFTAAPSGSKGFVRPGNMHHWEYTEKDDRGLDQAHLWMGVTEMNFTSIDDAAFQSMADARSAQKFNHLRGTIFPPNPKPDAPDLAWFQKTDNRIRYLNQKGIIADLILAPSPADLVKAFPDWQQRQRYVRDVVARYAAFHVTWEAAAQFEGQLDSRATLAEVGGLIKKLDPYQHPRTSGAKLTSTPLLDDKWMDFAAQGTANDQLGAVEHQLYAVPFVNLDLGSEDPDPAAFRHRLWNATMDGQYVTYAGSGQAKVMSVWFDFLSGTRHWELEPYFDVDGGRAVALEGAEYVVYVEKPGPVELEVEKHSYDVAWINPADGETVNVKRFNSEHFTGEPPDNSHDWVLHVYRQGELASMARSVIFSSRDQDLALQVVEANTPKVPFAIEQPTGNLSISKAMPFSAKLTHETRATRLMMWVWTGEVAAGHQGYRILATGQKGTMQVPADIANAYPATMHLRLYGMNALGKIYELDTACQVER